MTLILRNHSAGFFSSCCVMLYDIIEYCFINKKSPINILDNNTFTWYKPNRSICILNDFFNINKDIEINYENKCTFCYGETQFTKYSDLSFLKIEPYIKRFFNPSNKILDIKYYLKTKYSLDYNNTCVLFLRGNDKNKECNIPEYNEYIKFANNILKINPDIKFIIQSDEIGFIDYMKNIYTNNIIFYDEIRIIQKNINSTVDHNSPEINYKYILNFLAIVLIMSECKYIVCNTGNISLWISLFRGNTENFFQL